MTEPEVNPKGILKENIQFDSSGNALHIQRGAAFDSSHTYCHSAYRKAVTGSSTGNACIRVCCPAE
jgi:hypothetical protein